MSTVYRITGQGKRLTLKRLKAAVEAVGGTVTDDKKENSLIVEIDGQFVHFGRNENPRGAHNWFERFGLNDPEPLLDALAEAGYDCLSEHDEGF